MLQISQTYFFYQKLQTCTSVLRTVTLAILTIGTGESPDCGNGRLLVTLAQECGENRNQLPDLVLKQLHMVQGGLGVITMVIIGTGALVTSIFNFIF